MGIAAGSFRCGRPDVFDALPAIYAKKLVHDLFSPYADEHAQTDCTHPDSQNFEATAEWHSPAKAWSRLKRPTPGFELPEREDSTIDEAAERWPPMSREKFLITSCSIDSD